MGRIGHRRPSGASSLRDGPSYQAGSGHLRVSGSRYCQSMAKLSATERARLPDRAFAYIDSRGRRRLPIHDEAHVRNALGRFGRVAFEDDAAMERARTRLLNAAKKHGIVPVGFITGQLQSERKQAAAD